MMNLEQKIEKLKVGTYVRGTEGSHYSVTNHQMTLGVATRVENGGKFFVKILEHEEMVRIGEEFEVNIRYFDILEDTDPIVIKTTKEKEDSEIMLVVNDSLQDNLKRLKLQEEDYQYEITKTREKLAKAIKLMKEIQMKIKQEELKKDNSKEVIKKVKEQLELIKSDEKVTDLELQNDTIIIKTKQLYAEGYGVYEEGRFKLNAYEIRLRPKCNEVKIFGLLDEYNRRSCWTSKDPHPHINGRTGEGCWGNVQSMFCDTMGENEFYMTYMLVINFLETYNIDDLAGRNIRNWDFVDEDGYELELPRLNGCTWCGDEIENEDDVYTCDDCGDTVCGNCSRWSEYHERNICERCLDNYTYVESVEAYVKDDYVTWCNCCDNAMLNEEQDGYDEIFIDGRSFCCSDCAEDEGYRQCIECDEWHSKSSMKNYKEHLYCEDCYEDLGVDDCSYCEETFEEDDLKEFEGELYCSNCLAGKDISECDHCDELFYNENLKEGKDGQYYCECCYDDLFFEEEVENA